MTSTSYVPITPSSLNRRGYSPRVELIGLRLLYAVDRTRPLRLRPTRSPTSATSPGSPPGTWPYTMSCYSIERVTGDRLSRAMREYCSDAIQLFKPIVEAVNSPLASLHFRSFADLVTKVRRESSRGVKIGPLTPTWCVRAF